MYNEQTINPEFSPKPTKSSGKLNRSSKISLTSLGKDEVDEGELDGTQSQDILRYLNDTGSSRVFAISNWLNMDESDCVKLINILAKKGFIAESAELEKPEQQEDIGDLSELD